jgi:hypothetical protein
VPKNFVSSKSGEYKLSGGKTTTKLSEVQQNWVDTEAAAVEDTLQLISNLAGNFPMPELVSPLTHAAKVLKATLLAHGHRDLESLPLSAPLNLREIRENLSTMSELENSNPDVLIYDLSAEKLQLYKMEQFLRLRTSLNFSPRAGLTRHPDGKVTAKRIVDGMEDMDRVLKRDLIDRHLTFNMLTQRVLVNRQYRRMSFTPWITLLIDDSGSMNSVKKRGKALGLLFHFLNQVKANKMGLTMGWFETSVRGIENFLPGTDGTAWFEKCACKHNFNKGGTEAGDCIEYMLRYFQRDLPKILPEDFAIDAKQKDIVLVNDGQDDVTGVTPSVLDGAKLRAFVLEESNAELQRIALASQGSYMEL